MTSPTDRAKSHLGQVFRVVRGFADGGLEGAITAAGDDAPTETNARCPVCGEGFFHTCEGSSECARGRCPVANHCASSSSSASSPPACSFCEGAGRVTIATPTGMRSKACPQCRGGAR